jgi:hypothetical protein
VTVTLPLAASSRDRAPLSVAVLSVLAPPQADSSAVSRTGMAKWVLYFLFKAVSSM